MDERDKEALLEPGTEPQSNPASMRSALFTIGGFFVLGLALAMLLFGRPLLDSFGQAEAVVLPQIPTTAVDSAQKDGFILPLSVGDQAYDFTLSNLDGSDVSLSDFDGQPVIINFWATWCAPCRIEMPELQNANDTYEDLAVLAVNAQEDEQQVREFFEEMGFTMTALLDSDGEVGKAYGTPGLPSTFFIDRSGTVTAVHRGLLTADQIENYVAQILP